MTGALTGWLQKYLAIALQKLPLKRDHEPVHEQEQKD
jgi:hypothetical protein